MSSLGLDQARKVLDWELEETLTDQAYRVLEEEIVTLRIPPGAVVSEALLSKRFRVGGRLYGKRFKGWLAKAWS